MKTFSILTLIISCSFHCSSQSLEGEWRGSYQIDYTLPSIPIKLYFTLNKDSSYNIFSYSKGQDSKGRDTILVCKVLYKFLTKDSIQLEETEILKPKNALPACFQKMSLVLKRNDNSTELDGTWEHVSKECTGYGPIHFVKK